MKKEEIIIEDKTVNAAIEQICQQAEVSREDITFEIIQSPKKGFLGFNSAPAIVKGSYDMGKEKAAVAALTELIGNMGAENFTIDTVESEDRINLMIHGTGNPLDFLIGKKGEVLDSIQFLLSLIVNNEKGSEFKRVFIDCNDYRVKREEDLEKLVQTMVERVVKTQKSVTMEPMSSYERRLVHSVVQELPGVTSSSVGSEPRRCVVIKPE